VAGRSVSRAAIPVARMADVAQPCPSITGCALAGGLLAVRFLRQRLAAGGTADSLGGNLVTRF
jgi:hypothetical protein